MTYYVTALTNNKARLIVKKAQFTNDVDSADMIADLWADQGFSVIRSEEG